MNLNNYTIEPEWMSNDYPNNIDDYIGNFYAKNVFEKWIKRFDKNLPEYKKINKAIFIWGKTGAGKSCIVKLMLKKYNYNPTELNVSNIKSPKSLSEIIKSFKTTSNTSLLLSVLLTSEHRYPFPMASYSQYHSMHNYDVA